MQVLQILLLTALCMLILEGIRAGWVATGPASRSGKDRSREGTYGGD
jgi:hypothetical protein